MLFGKYKVTVSNVLIIIIVSDVSTITDITCFAVIMSTSPVAQYHSRSLLHLGGSQTMYIV